MEQNIKQPRISAIAAIGQNRELGKDGDLIWKLEGDFDRMKSLIRGHTLVMGRSTYESIGVELPYTNVVITRDRNYKSPYAPTKHTHIVHSLEDALKKANELETKRNQTNPEVFIFGGALVYETTMGITQRLYLTIIDAEDKDADTFFPRYDDFMTILEETTYQEDGISYRMLTLERVQNED